MTVVRVSGDNTSPIRMRLAQSPAAMKMRLGNVEAVRLRFQSGLPGVQGAPGENGAPGEAGPAGSSMVYDSRVDAAAATIPDDKDFIYVAGYAEPGDGGAAVYKRISSPGTPELWQFLSADGSWWELAETIVDPRMLGADATGSDDSYDAIQAAVDYLPAGGGTVAFASGTYLTSDTITIGNGTSSARSSRVGVILKGVAGGGVGEGEFGAPNAGVIIRYTGGSGAFTPVVELTGPIHSCVLEDLTIDANDLAGRGVTAIHPYQCRLVNVQAENWSNAGFYLTSHNATPAGVTQGIMDNILTQCQARTPNGTAGHGFLLEGYDHASAFVPCSRNVLIQCHALIPGAAGSSGLKMVFADNNHVERFTANWASATVLGHGLILNGSTAHPGLCQENQFHNCTFVGGYSLTGGTNGNNLFLGYNTSDGAPLPSFGQGQKFLLPDGRAIGGFAGSVISWAGRTDPGAGAGTVLKYLAPQGVSAQQATRFDADFCLPSGYKLVSLRTNLGVVPGGATTRIITVLKNGSATAATLTYTAAQSGDKRWSDSAGVDFSGGDMICIRSDVTGAPANSNVQYALEFYPLEVV